jgi:hypothetical protein
MKTKIIIDGGYFRNYLEQHHFEILKDQVNETLAALRPDVASLTDILPFANRMLGPFGNEDMQIYNRFFSHVYATPGVRERAPWWELSYKNDK